jgi:hypothetical protein
MTTLAIALALGFLLGWIAGRYYRLRRVWRSITYPMNEERAQALRSLAAADYAQFSKSRKKPS